MNKLISAFALAGALAVPALVYAQTPSDGTPDKAVIHGSVQSDFLFVDPSVDMGGAHYDDNVMLNLYGDAMVTSKYVDGGLRFEYLEHPLPGFEPQFKGWGVPNIYVKGKFAGVELTVGDYYEQFGSGLILRTFEDRALGIDNSLRGARLQVKSVPGMRFTALAGVQRDFWDWSMRSKMYGANYELDMQQFVPSMRKHNAALTLGASYVLKHESDEQVIVPMTNYALNLPKNVSAFDVRAQYNQNGWGLLAEYAWKGQDPNVKNDYTYGKGSTYLLSASYSRSGLSALVQAKRSENFRFQSKRSSTESLGAFLNYMPPFTYQHTYTLAAMYPYSSPTSPGEWAFQGAFAYKFKRNTPLGGKYGTSIKLNGSWIRALTGTMPEPFYGSYYGTDGLKTKFFGMGDAYYHDINVQIEKKVTSGFNFTFMYMNQMYNQYAVEGHGEPAVKSNIFVYDGKYKLSRKVTLRTELQYLQTKQDHGDWVYGLAEVSVLPYLMFSLSDQWNCGGDEGHYYMATVTANYRSNRFMLGFGRTRAGYNCSGGVCRWVPESRGVTFSYNYNF